ncbi:hypothetical protein IGI04_031659 [Brassica rapa subsp. trilocularis]|uniref:Uncharacterized protein n=1 Tax=Brassica rapa subsp. trilocularis TaxID=1813537 RepID=A0ABQ7LWR0_BRACM|nr:hypothetical protein IGI04_031659 [Brassica rapa subsp. trilocularis]
MVNSWGSLTDGCISGKQGSASHNKAAHSSDYDVDSAVRVRVLPTISKLFHSLRPPEQQFKE